MTLNGFLSGGSDQDQQRSQIKALAGDRSVTFYKEKGRSDRPFTERTTLQRCVAECKTNASVFAISSLQHFAKRNWQGLEFLEVVAGQGVSIEVADDPIISQGSIHVLSANAQVQRDRIVARSQAGLDRIKAKLKAGKPHITRSGREINTLGTRDPSALQAAGNKRKQDKADAFALGVWPHICTFYERGCSQTEIARQLNLAKIKNVKGNSWTQNAVHRVIKRLKKNEIIKDDIQTGVKKWLSE